MTELKKVLSLIVKQESLFAQSYGDINKCMVKYKESRKKQSKIDD